MILLGLTGSIGMGKSTAATMLRALGLPVHDADATVHRLLGKGGAAVAKVDAAFPGVVSQGAVDRRLLGNRVFGDDASLRRLEKILHPMVRAAERRFLGRMRRQRRKIAVLDIPLLYETGGEARVDAVIVVSAPARIQALRVLRRPGMTPQKFRAILAKQISDSEKRRHADFVVTTGLSRAHSLRQLKQIVRLTRDNSSRYKTRRSRHA
ncbi:MAG: dephospho-CoA kinase [Alphaproteobacteria bacterium]|nr:dephospho-CoA kinase [Alphaproteobacteria bacterium]MBU0798913.1 dephospho-CoA kinase [Alphaproteobacteria bacterium]MBU0886301.1 dephospho-CoA kinase [Alphaproteobacteria bacterium]MBU1813503.1 dephospho-CoA kinase [Alphaproteobacteria bacterium]MBU2091695.1 dephospho-CoA kinase [Alphaproteobacteria bacterium]